MPAHWKVGLIPIPLVGGALFLGEIRCSCVPGVSLGSLFTEEWVCDPTWIVCPRASQHCWLGQIFSKWPHLEEHMLMNVPENLASNVLPSQ